MDAAAPQFDPLLDDPTPFLEEQCPGILEYYEKRRAGTIEEMPLQETEGHITLRAAKTLWNIEHGKVQHVFFPIKYDRGFTHRGRELSPCDEMHRLLTRS